MDRLAAVELPPRFAEKKLFKKYTKQYALIIALICVKFTEIPRRCMCEL